MDERMGIFSYETPYYRGFQTTSAFLSSLALAIPIANCVTQFLTQILRTTKDGPSITLTSTQYLGE